MKAHVIDAKNKRLGRVASEIAILLQGKRSPRYAPHVVSTDRVLVKNVHLLDVGSEKYKKKVYYRHTGYVGHLKERSFTAEFSKDPRRVLRGAVRHMLPKNFLNARRLKNLVFADNKE